MKTSSLRLRVCCRSALLTLITCVTWLASLANAGWVPTGNLATARFGHAATLLRDGTVLVVGGIGPNNDRMLGSAELYDPVSGTWDAIVGPHDPRSGHTATLLPDGRVLVAGGASGQGPLKSAELYDPLTHVWTTTGDLRSPHSSHTATLLLDGRVLVFGGTGDFDAVHAAELYDPATGTWSSAGRPAYARNGPEAALLQDGHVLVFGGLIADYDPDFEFPLASNAEIYDPASNSWTIAGEAIIAYGETATLLSNGDVLAAGGFSVVGNGQGSTYSTRYAAWLFDPSSRSWLPVGRPKTDHIGPAATRLVDGRVLLTGAGFDNRAGNAEIYDPSGAEAWTITGPMTAPRYGHTATLLANGNVLVVGGLRFPSQDGLDPLGSAEVYAVNALVPATISPGFSGAWIDPAQSGQGLFVEVLPDNRFLALWATFNPAGAQAWFVGIGTYSGNVATVASMVQPSGGRWIPNFDPTQVASNAWGTLTFTFTDCNHGRVDFNSVAGYGSGSMNLTRLTLPLGLSCP